MDHRLSSPHRGGQRVRWLIRRWRVPPLMAWWAFAAMAAPASVQSRPGGGHDGDLAVVRGILMLPEPDVDLATARLTIDRLIDQRPVRSAPARVRIESRLGGENRAVREGVGHQSNDGKSPSVQASAPAAVPFVSICSVDRIVSVRSIESRPLAAPSLSNDRGWLCSAPAFISWRRYFFRVPTGATVFAANDDGVEQHRRVDLALMQTTALCGANRSSRRCNGTADVSRLDKTCQAWICSHRLKTPPTEERFAPRRSSASRGRAA